MELREIQTFVRAAQTKNFSRAAADLGYSQAAVTVQIANLEQELGIRLFDRMHRQTELTPRGKIFYDHALVFLQELSQAKAAASEKSEPEGTLRIGAIESIASAVLPDLLGEYCRSCPKVNVSVCLDSPIALMDLLEQSQIDLVYLVDQQIRHPKFVTPFEAPEEIVFCAPSGSHVAACKSLTVGDLLDEPFILTEKNASYRFTLDQYLAFSGREITPYLEIGNTDFIIRMVEHGAGLSFLPLYAIRRSVEAGTVSVLPVNDFHMRLWRQIIYKKNRWLTLEMSRFIELASAD